MNMRSPMTRKTWSLLFAGSLVLAALVTQCDARTVPNVTLTPQRIQAALDEARKTFKDNHDGANANYIPILDQMPSELFGIALVTADGRVYTSGDVDRTFSIQSISKVFTLAEVVKESGIQAVEDNVGVDATGEVFNSIAAIERHQGHEMNPFVNPGAIATTSMVQGRDRDDIWAKIIGIYDEFANAKLTVLDDVYHSEAATNQRNQAIGRLMFAYGRITNDPDRATDIYTEQCSVGVDARQLATMAATLANGGTNPVTHRAVITPEQTGSILAVMATGGLYDDSGKWLVRTGLPAKSGVGGGIIAVAPGKFGIAAFSPRLDEAGNSVRAQLAIAYVTRALGANPYEVVPAK